MRHWTFGCAMTLGASSNTAGAVTVIAPPTVARNLRRARITSSSCNELVVGAFGDAIPRTDERLELRIGGMDLPGHRRLLRLLPDHVSGDLLEIAEHRTRKREDLDFRLEL